MKIVIFRVPIFFVNAYVRLVLMAYSFKEERDQHLDPEKFLKENQSESKINFAVAVSFRSENSVKNSRKKKAKNILFFFVIAGLWCERWKAVSSSSSDLQLLELLLERRPPKKQCLVIIAIDQCMAILFEDYKKFILFQLLLSQWLSLHIKWLDNGFVPVYCVALNKRGRKLMKNSVADEKFATQQKLCRLQDDHVLCMKEAIP